MDARGMILNLASNVSKNRENHCQY